MMLNVIDKINLGWYYNQKSMAVKGTVKEIAILREAVSKAVQTPYTYDRLSILLLKKGKVKEAIKVCKKYKEIMNRRLSYRQKMGYIEDISSIERAIIRRLARIAQKLV